MNLNNVNQIEILALLEIIHQIKLCSNNNGYKEELLSELQNFLKK